MISLSGASRNLLYRFFVQTFRGKLVVFVHAVSVMRLGFGSGGDRFPPKLPSPRVSFVFACPRVNKGQQAEQPGRTAGTKPVEAARRCITKEHNECMWRRLVKQRRCLGLLGCTTTGAGAQRQEEAPTPSSHLSAVRR